MVDKVQTFDKALTPETGLTRRGDYNADLVASGDPRQWGHYYVERRDIGFVCGIWRNAPFESRPNRFSGHEFFHVVEGSVTIEEPDGSRVEIGRGDFAVVPHGLEHRWIQTHPATLFFAKAIDASVVDPDTAPTRVVRIDTSLTMPRSTPPLPGLLLSDLTPTTTEHTFYRTPSGKMTVGMWTATPYRRRSIPYPRYEIMTLLTGSTSFPEPEGKANEVRAGETVVVPHGLVAEWCNREPVRKVACNFFVD